MEVTVVRTREVLTAPAASPANDLEANMSERRKVTKNRLGPEVGFLRGIRITDQAGRPHCAQRPRLGSLDISVTSLAEKRRNDSKSSWLTYKLQQGRMYRIAIIYMQSEKQANVNQEVKSPVSHLRAE